MRLEKTIWEMHTTENTKVVLAIAFYILCQLKLKNKTTIKITQ